MSSMSTVTVQSQQRLASAPFESSELTQVLRVLLSSMLLLEATAFFTTQPADLSLLVAALERD